MAKAKRVVTPQFQELHELFAKTITVRVIAERIRACFAEEDAELVRRRMEEAHFDVLGVEVADDVIYGYVERSRLGKGPCKHFHKLFHPSELLSASTPLLEVMPLLAEKSRLFVLEHRRVTHIVTRSDLEKAPVRLLLYGLLTLLEMQLANLVRLHYDSDGWQKVLSKGRLQKAEELLREREQRNEEIDLTDCLQFSDKRDLVLRSEKLRALLAIQSRKAGERFFSEAEALRDRLAHAQSIVNGSSWPKIINLTEKINALLRRGEEVSPA